MVRALERGLNLEDFEVLTIGMIIGYITTYNECNSNEENDERDAEQSDFDVF